MTSKSSRPTFRPCLETLEGRVCPSTLQQPLIPPPIHGGAIVEVNQVVFASTFNRDHNTVQVVDDGKGDVQVSWNGGAIHSFTGVKDVVVTAAGQTNDVTFSLTDKLTSPLALDLLLSGQSTFIKDFTPAQAGGIPQEKWTQG